jgi:hypothetical protein
VVKHDNPGFAMIDPELTFFFRHFAATSNYIVGPWCFPPEDARYGTFLKALRDSKLAFLCLVAHGRRVSAGSPPPMNLDFIVVFNARRGSGSTHPALMEMITSLAKEAGTDYFVCARTLKHFALMEVATRRVLKVSNELLISIADWLHISTGSFELERLELKRSTIKGSGFMAALVTKIIGEIGNIDDFSAMGWTPEAEILLGSIRGKAEMGFLSANLRARANLASDVSALGLDSQALEFWPKATPLGAEAERIGQPFYLLTPQDHRTGLRERLIEISVSQRQDHVVFVRRDGSIETIAPYHEVIKNFYVDLRCALRAYAGMSNPNGLLPEMEVRLGAPPGLAR